MQTKLTNGGLNLLLYFLEMSFQPQQKKWPNLYLTWVGNYAFIHLSSAGKRYWNKQAPVFIPVFRAPNEGCVLQPHRYSTIVKLGRAEWEQSSVKRAVCGRKPPSPCNRSVSVFPWISFKSKVIKAWQTSGAWFWFACCDFEILEARQRW